MNVPAPAEPRDVPILGRMIRLGQLLKLAGTIESGSDARALLASETVLINGEPDERRGRQLHHGDVVSVAGEELRVVVPGEDEQDTPAK